MSVIEQRPPASPSPSTGEHHNSKKIKKRIRNILTYATVGMTASAVVGGGFMGKYYADDEMFIPKVIKGYFTDQACSTRVTRADMQAVHKTLTNPVDSSVISTRIYESFEEHKKQIISEADKLNITIIDNTQAIEDLEKTKTVNEVLFVVNNYTSNFGMEIELAETTSMRDVGWGIKPVNKQNIDFKEFKHGAESLLWSYTYTPVEVDRADGMKKIKIVEKVAPSVPWVDFYQKVPGASANPVTGIIYISLNKFYKASYNDYAHEKAHGSDYQECGLWGMFRDPQFKKLNPTGFEYKIGNYQDIGSVIKSEYAGRHVIEDKATHREDLFLGSAEYVYKKEFESRQKKQDVLIARLEKKVPNIATYIRLLD